MNPLKLKVLEDIIKHLSSSQGQDLKGLLDESKKPPEMEIPGGKESEAEEMGDMGKPKDLAIEMDVPLEEEGKSEMPGGESEMSDSEMEEMIKKYLSA